MATYESKKKKGKQVEDKPVSTITQEEIKKEESPA